MNGPEPLAQAAGVLRTRVGAAFPGSHAVFRGHDLHQDLQHLGWLDLYAFGVTGRKLTPAQSEMIQALWVCTSYPDSRIWNNRVAALAANARSSTHLAMIAGVAVSEAMVYGGNAALRSMQFIQQAVRRTTAGEALEDIVWSEARQNKIFGYGRPISSADERLAPIMALAEKLGMHNGPHLSLAFAVERILLTRYPNLRMNFGGLQAALFSDMGLSVREYQVLRMPQFTAGMAPCVVEAAEKEEGTLFPTPCSAVAFQGPAPRAWPSR
jgi:hypothetical protein